MSSKAREQFINKLKNSIEDDNEDIIGEGYYEWKIDDWKGLRIFQVSPTFTIGDYKWRMALLPTGYTDGHDEFVSLYLGNYDVENDESLNIYSNYVFVIRNYTDYSCFKYEKTTNTVLFDINHSEHHFPKFIRKNNLSTIIKKTNKPIMEDNKVVIGVYVRIYYENN
ncbi:hypothetical protein H8356DRAFT_1297859 [Neocallimastix lanati (nom. inval.)]|uniref:MATH domain-containing protein n=1 Tax=Neocallimastix californiae TaxID=1754190 RepID=A0A1Y2ACC5_9FUNG|nr:hypothetical protein H8356DRAFT_1297859 [Neocallimastix sp. JGI-2020a]ORY20124.1 hypothetical protein LY90DRAFT_161000 [Neocallimastix californiae]|eukprot:ORY20124.1 hypothetical protein LY90DRAFT_161000 [Neocallimastix californiae]